MAEPTDQPETPKPADEAEDLPLDTGRRRQFIILCAGVLAIAGGAGYGAAILGGSGQSEPLTAPSQTVTEAGDQTVAKPYQYFDLDPVTVNLDEPRLARYVCVSVTLEISDADFAEAKKLIDTRMPVLANWLTVYFANCTLDDIRGASNLNRIQREILDAFNAELWPDQKPKINGILFKKLTVS